MEKFRLVASSAVLRVLRCKLGSPLIQIVPDTLTSMLQEGLPELNCDTYGNISNVVNGPSW